MVTCHRYCHTEAEAELMQGLADEEVQPDDGAIEIDLYDAYNV